MHRWNTARNLKFCIEALLTLGGYGQMVISWEILKIICHSCCLLGAAGLLVTIKKGNGNFFGHKFFTNLINTVYFLFSYTDLCNKGEVKEWQLCEVFKTGMFCMLKLKFKYVIQDSWFYNTKWK